MSRAGTKRSSGVACPEPANKRFRSSYYETITVLVGPEEEKFVVHKSTACDNSPFFQTACSQRWIEGREKTVRLPDTTSRTFETFLHWAYRKELKVDDASDDEGSHPRTHDLGSIWGLAHFLQNSTLQNKVIDRLLQKFDAIPHSPIPRAALYHIWGLSPPESTIRRLLINVLLARMSHETFNQYLDEWPQDLIVPAAKLFFAGKKVPLTVRCPSFADRCRFHEHDDGEKEKCDGFVEGADGEESDEDEV